MSRLASGHATAAWPDEHGDSSLNRTLDEEPGRPGGGRASARSEGRTVGDPNDKLRTIDQNKHRAAASVDRAISSTTPSTTPIVIDLPVPPSANRLWRGTGRTVVRGDQYTAWLRAADAHTL